LGGGAEVRQQQTQLSEAEENLERLKDQVAVQVERLITNCSARRVWLIAQQLVALRTEGERLTSNQFRQGVVLVSEGRRAGAETYNAQADLLQANLAYVLARTELDRTIGIVSQF
jgi:hypothetical protein